MKQIGFLFASFLGLLFNPGSASTVHAQEGVLYPFEESLLAVEQNLGSHLTRSANINPLLESYDVKFYGLDVEVGINSDKIKGNATILVEVINPAIGQLVFELYHSLDVEMVLVDGAKMSYSHEGDELYIDLETPPYSGDLLTAQIFYGGQTGEGMVNEIDEEWGIPVSYTSSEPFYSKDWFPCKQDLSDKADSVHVFITTDFGLMGVSNGLHTGTTYFPDGRVRYEWKSNYPIDYYLICIALSDYIEYNLEAQVDELNTPIFIQNFIYDKPGCLDAYKVQIDMTIPIMRVFCHDFGPYPHRNEKYGHYLWPRGGGMEHQTMTGMGNFEFYLLAHELGHSWFGNFVTCATWQDIWVNEGFATFAGYRATEILGPEYADGEREYRFGRALLEPDGSVYVPEEDADDASRIFSANLSYNKGMALLYMIRYELQDDDLFYLSLRNFLDRYANDVATGMDFKQVLEETSGMDFTDFFKQWYFGEGYPIYDLAWEQAGNTLSLYSTQSTSSSQTPLFRMSMEYKIFYAGGDTTVRVFHGANEEIYQFQIPHMVSHIVIDPNNHVLDGLSQDRKGIQRDDDSPLFSFAPNPNHGSFNFCLNEDSREKGGYQIILEVLDLAGKTIFSSSYRAIHPYMEYAVELEDAPEGIYLIRFSCGNRVEVHKLLVE
jgi:aminopeptidase N